MGEMARMAFGTIIASAATLLAPLGSLASAPEPDDPDALRACAALEHCLGDPMRYDSECALLRCESHKGDL